MGKFVVDTDRGTVTPQGSCFETFFILCLGVGVVAAAIAGAVKLAIIVGCVLLAGKMLLWIVTKVFGGSE